ncbi:MAG TPA: bifunctional oligoribonuclease/PAP phosphatase NrnA [Clostridia bacterium]|nr:bifunctional oligoribonuclease/PAP phosphatase NrnA [Clostridia bacterium]
MNSEIIRLLSKAESVTLISHVNPDGDALGSAAALKLALENLGKKVYWFCDGVIPRNYSIIPGIESLMKPDSEHCAGVCVAVDSADIGRCGSARAIFEKAEETINIDHHVSNTLYARHNHVVGASSTGEIMYRLITALGVKIDEPIAKALYIAISTDTGGFSYSNTTPETLRIVANLLECGMDSADISDKLYRCRTYAKTRLIAAALNNLVIRGDIAYIKLAFADYIGSGAQEADTEGLVDYAREIEGMQVGFLARETENGEVKVSLRSNGDIDVCVVAARFGGGGHKQAAGCTIRQPIDKAIDMVLDCIAENR